jgi:outer membrane protein assembly factor BamB
MRHTRAALLAGLLGLAAAAGRTDGDWLNWRGPTFNGAAQASGLPVKWTTTEGIVWKTKLPGPSAATPAVAKGRIFLSAMEEGSMTLLAMGFDRATGKELWRHTTGRGRAARRPGFENTMAAPSPVTDGEVVCFLFGTGYLAGYDLDGTKRWERDLVADHGRLAIGWGYASSPLLVDGTLYVQAIRSGESYLLALDPKTGKNRWRHVREDPSRAESEEAYTTPIPFDNQGRREILVLGGDCVTAHDPKTGAEHWRWCGLNPNDRGNFRIISNTLTGPDGFVYVTSPQGNPLHALRVRGDEVEKVWTIRRPTPDVVTPLLYEGRLYVVDGKRRRRIACLVPQTGEQIWQADLDTHTHIRSSPTAADGKIYLMDAEGLVTVLAAGPKHEVLGRNELGSYPSRASIVIDDDQLLVRTADHLYCVGAAASAPAASTGSNHDSK